MSRYKESEKLLERALKTIPLGSQTFSKSMGQYPFGVSPYFIKKGEGSIQIGVPKEAPIKPEHYKY